MLGVALFRQALCASNHGDQNMEEILMCETEKAKTSVDAGLLTSTSTGRYVLMDHHARDADFMEPISKRVMVVVLSLLLGLVFIPSAGKGQTDVESNGY